MSNLNMFAARTSLRIARSASHVHARNPRVYAARATAPATTLGIRHWSFRSPLRSGLLPSIYAQSTHFSPIRRWNSSSASTVSSPSSSTSDSASSTPSEPQASKDPRLSLTFTCTAPIAVPSESSVESSSSSADPAVPQFEQCGHRSTHTFTKRAYEKGIVIIACPGCKNRHLIADNLGWFKNQDGSEGGKTVEDFVRANGETVKRGELYQAPDGDVEFVP
ncbi:zf-DNL-domain-containing protein [Clavulina sp. PMI_390]|nr:zf-DNL-domain-containing protein [Clavulina sp. PMI_390]